MDTIDEKETVVYQTEDRESLESCSLVLSAVGIDHRITHQQTLFTIEVHKPEQKDAALYHLHKYLEENSDWPPPKDQSQYLVSTSRPPTIFLIGALVIFYAITGPWTSRSLWFSLGAGDADAILKLHQYYRLVTALTLHANLTHLMGNIVFGGFILHFLCRAKGTGLTLFSTILAALIGNLINVLAHGGNHHFVGFSTAVFSAIGILAMLSYHHNRHLSGVPVLMPFMAGAALLAMIGSSGERTDLGAHLFGLLAGFGIGKILTTSPLRRIQSSNRIQSVLFILTTVFVVFCWQLAFAV